MLDQRQVRQHSGLVFVAAPFGFAEQGAKIHAFINEEPAIRTQMRAISCYTGMTREEIIKIKR